MILIATAAPARAASLPGTIQFNAAGANIINNGLNVSAQVMYTGGAGDLPVTALLVSVVIPAAIVASPTAAVGSGLWQQVGSASPDPGDASKVVFQFLYLGPDLSTENDLTITMPVQISRIGDLTNFDVLIRANGESDGAQVPQIMQTVTTTTGAELVFNVTPPMQAQSNYQGLGPAYVFYGETRWNGPWNPPGAEVHDIRFIARVPVENTTQQFFETVRGDGWNPPTTTVVEGYFRIEYTYDGTLGPSNSQTTNLQFAVFSSAGGPALNVAIARIEGVSADGSTVFTQFTGPTLLDGPAPVLTPYPPDYPGLP